MLIKQQKKIKNVNFLGTYWITPLKYTHTPIHYHTQWNIQFKYNTHTPSQVQRCKNSLKIEKIHSNSSTGSKGAHKLNKIGQDKQNAINLNLILIAEYQFPALPLFQISESEEKTGNENFRNLGESSKRKPADFSL